MSNPRPLEDIIYDTVASMVDGLLGEGEDGSQQGNQVLEDFFASEMEAMAANRHRPRRADGTVVGLRPNAPSGPPNDGSISHPGVTGGTGGPRYQIVPRRRGEHGRRIRLEFQEILCVCCGRFSIQNQTYRVEARRDANVPTLLTNDLELEWDRCIHCLVDEAVMGSLEIKIVKKDMKKAKEMTAEKGDEVDRKDTSSQN